MKKILFLSLLISINTSAKWVQGLVLDIEGIPLKDVLIKNKKTGVQFISDDSGSFTIDGNDTDSISFTLKGFSTLGLTVKNIRNAQNKVYLFPQMQYTLSEITIVPIDIYNLYQKAVINLKSRLIVNQAFLYNCIGKEQEINFGSQRGLYSYFTSELQSANPQKEDLNYKFLLSELETTSSHSEDSDILKDNKFNIYLFSRRIKNYISKSTQDSVSFIVSNSAIVIYDKSDLRGLYTYTINISDTTLTGMTYELLQPEEKYTNRRTFKAKDLQSHVTVQFSSKSAGYYLSSLDLNYDTSFLTGKPQREERLICIYKISIAQDSIKNAQKEFKPRNKFLYELKTYNNVARIE